MVSRFNVRRMHRINAYCKLQNIFKYFLNTKVLINEYFIFSSKMTPTLLSNILTENKLNTKKNYKEWKTNLIIVLSCEKLKIVFDNKCPPTTQAETRKSWEQSDEIA